MWDTFKNAGLKTCLVSSAFCFHFKPWILSDPICYHVGLGSGSLRLRVYLLMLWHMPYGLQCLCCHLVTLSGNIWVSARRLVYVCSFRLLQQVHVWSFRCKGCKGWKPTGDRYMFDHFDLTLIFKAVLTLYENERPKGHRCSAFICFMCVRVFCGTGCVVTNAALFCSG